MGRFYIILLLLVAYFSNALARDIIYSNTKDLRPFTSQKLSPISILEELPSDFPLIVVDSINEPSEGNIIMECFQVSSPDENYIMILDNQGQVLWYDKAASQGMDFKLQPNGRFSYASAVKIGDKYQAGPLTVQNVYVQHKILDENKNIIDSMQMANEYLADMHDFRILPNGNYLMISYERVPIDMSRIIPNGNPNAIVVGTVIQELDKDKNCVYQWRSLDYIPVLATKDDPRKAIFEHVHGNSLFIDKDGNLITSFPTTFEIVKIDMVTGELIWRLGGDSNQFEFSGENEADKPYYFRMQHDAKIIDNGNLLFYDNAVQKKSGWNSRAVEYSLDEINKKVNLVWEYKHNPPVSAFAMGSAQRLDNGNTLVNWGLMFLGLNKGMTEVTSEKETKFELTFPALNFSYRAQKVAFPACQPVAAVDKYEMVEGNTYLFNDETDETGVELYFNKLDAFMYNLMNIKKYKCSPIDPEFEGEAPVLLSDRYKLTPQLIYSFDCEVRFDITKLPRHNSVEKLIVYYRPNENSGVFTALPTTYNAGSKQLIATSSEFGEYVIGYIRDADMIYPPKLMYPINDKSFVNGDTVRIAWSSTGRFDDFQLQIADDEEFANIIYDSSNVKSSVQYKADLPSNKTYYWRAKTFYRDLASDWSAVNSFNLSEPFLYIISPSGGEYLTKDSTIAIRWATNISDSLSVELLRDGNKELVLSENIVSYFDALSWKVANTVPNDNNYTILVSDKNGSNIIAESNPFEIGMPVGVNYDVKQTEVQAEIITSPNPASDNVLINLTLNKSDYVNLAVFDELGNLKRIIVDTYLSEGMYNIPLSTLDLPQGVYYCLMRTINYSIVNKIIVIR